MTTRTLLIAVLLIMTFASGAFGQGTAASTPSLRKWSDSSFPLPWRLNLLKGNNVTGSRELADVFRSAFQAWSGVGSALVSFQEGSPSPVTDPGFDQVNLITLVPANYTSGALALTLSYSFSSTGIDQFGRRIEFPGQMLEADIMFNPATLFSTDGVTPSDKFDLESVAVHEIGHLLGLDHNVLPSAVMFPTLSRGKFYARTLSTDDAIGVSKLYPTSAFFASRGGVNGVVRTAAGAGVFGANVVVLDASGRPVASTFTDPNGNYQVVGLEPGPYSTFVEPLDGPASSSSFSDLPGNFPSATIAANFSTRFITASSAPFLALIRAGGNAQTGNMGEVLASLLEVQVTDVTGAPVSGATVNFSGTSGGATVIPFVGTTDSQGKIRATAYLGTGLTQEVTAFAGSAKATFTATVGAPVLTTVASNSGARGTSVNVTLTGKNFVKNGSTVTVSGSGVNVTAVSVTSSRSLSATFAIDANALATVRTVTVTAPNGTSGPVNFTVQ